MSAAKVIAWSLLCWVLSSCGGGSSVATNNGGGVGTGGTGITMGTVTGFGSVVIDGKSYSSASPQYFAQNSQSEAAPATPADVVLGSQVQMDLDAQGNPASVIIAPMLVGAVQGLDASGFAVSGMRVRINNLPAAGPLTYFSGLQGAASVNAGMQVAISGVYGIDRTGTPFVQATLVERLPDSNRVTRTSGVVSGLNTSAHTFQIGTMTIDYSGATQVSPALPALSNGQFVKVWTNQSLSNSGQFMRANTLRIVSLVGRSGPVQISGLVANLAGSGFTLGGIAIDASAPSLASTVAGLAHAQYVTLQGQIDSNTGTILASAIVSYRSQPVQTEIKGTITGYIDSNAFFVRGVPVDASQLGAASVATLTDGVYVDIIGTVGASNAGVIVASSLSVIAQAPAGETLVYRGAVSQLNTLTQTFTLTRRDGGGLVSEPITLSSNVSYSNGTVQQLVNGTNIEVEATKTASGLRAYSINFIGLEPAPGSGSKPPVLVQGRVESLSATSMSVCGINIQIGGVAVQNGPLANGAKVAVWLGTSAGTSTAQTIVVLN